ncbi:MAG: hypothetical protein ABSH22_16000 [Tepidisphaeraceae bacterium]|jgi:hypothetical protein
MHTTHHHKFVVIFVIPLIAFLPLPGLAQALADHVPGDAIGYIGCPA